MAGVQNLPADTARIVTTLANLAPLVDAGETPLTPGTWCWNAPPWGYPFLPHDRQEGDRAGLEHEHPNLVECRGLRTLGNLVRAWAELGRVTAGWDAVPVEMTDRAACRANRDLRAFVLSVWTPRRRSPDGGTGTGGKSVARS